MKNKDYLILLNETERSLLEEALTQYIKNPFLGTGNWVNLKAREKVRIQMQEVLNIIKNFEGAIRKEFSYEFIYHMKNALVWYSYMLPVEDGMNDYSKLAYTIEGRNTHNYLFDFDPNNYNPKEKKLIDKKDFSKTSYLIIRQHKDQIDFVSEVVQKPNQEDEDYKQRVQEIFERLNPDKKEKENWKIITNTQLSEYKIHKKCSYYCNLT